MSPVRLRERILGGLWGSVVGDALGVPVEFKDRATVRLDPVTGMRGHGTHGQPAGTWSDDSSLLLCSTESLVRSEFDTEDMGRQFVAWHRAETWTPWGRVFDIGGATARALGQISSGTPAELAGGAGESDNGNGSLMRILPVALRFAGAPPDQLVCRIRRASAITHRHPRAQMACVFFALVVRALLGGESPRVATQAARAMFRDLHHGKPEFPHFLGLLEADLPSVPEADIKSGGYVIDTLMASLWCLVTTRTFPDCVLQAVNLGQDTDTTGCVAGGLAGFAYGSESIPEDWRRQLARHDEIGKLFDPFAVSCNA